MRQLRLVGVNLLGEPVQLATLVNNFTTEDGYISVRNSAPGEITLTTPKGSYRMKRHPSQNIYQGVLNGHKCHVTLAKVVGKVIYW